ncbi:hypothetical protein KIH87_18330 [Paraneptunicella aestuarii]|uniref:hypothetical protein n=1 Tax=Paraneptunicella aestuarii TaxID=2831148 RepID=UPI001E3380E5|nr:hypothetical protein [Paraneptunicella aestuarii]UAA38596.1 hypothetical protein KIH87_18330 [Paraneptunicella aestuarii]
MKLLTMISMIILATSSFADEMLIDKDCNRNQLQSRSNCALKALHNLLESPPKPITISTPDGQLTFSSEQLMAHDLSVLNSELGLEADSQLVFDRDKLARSKNKSQKGGENLSVKAVDLEEFAAIEKIVAIAKEHQIVMINEAHHVSMHRFFAKNLALALRKIGFTHIAAETFSDLSSLKSSGYPTIETGVYTSDPEFGDFIRSAALAGYKFVKYEAAGNKREFEQAQNIAQALQKMPNAKILVYAGYGHIKENVSSQGQEWMAAQFKKFTGIDPLTIDQVSGTARYEDELTDPTYKFVEPYLETQSLVFKNKNDEWLVSTSYSEAVDLTVFHPREEIVNGRANWLVNKKDRQLYRATHLPKERPIAVKAVIEDEWNEKGIKSIPMDQILLKDSESIANLYLPPGNYRILIDSLSGKKYSSKTILISN